VAFAERKIGLPLTNEIKREDLLYRLHYATDGVVGNVMNLLRFGASFAQRHGREFLDLDILATVFSIRLEQHVHKRNPFVQSGAEGSSSQDHSVGGLDHQGKQQNSTTAEQDSSG
jgi:hypothetical protein